MRTQGDIRTPSDAELLAAHRKGDPEAFPELVRRYAPRLYGFLFHMTGDRDHALDLVQETFLRVHQAAGRFDGRRPFRPWVFQIAARLQADLRKSWFWRLARRSVSLEAEPAAGGTPLAGRLPAGLRDDPSRTAEQRVTAEALRGELLELDPVYRRALLLHDLEGFTCQEIAALTGVPLGSVLSQLRRGRERLRVRLAAKGGWA